MVDETLSEFIAAIPTAAAIIDQSERIVASNQDAKNLLGDQIDGRHFATILRQPLVIEAVEQCLSRKEPVKTRHLSNDGAQDTTFEVHCRYIKGAVSEGEGAVLISFIDVTPLEHAGQMRRDFVANVSHELRTPLTALMGFIETLRGPARDDASARERFLQIMADEANRMNRLVGDLLSLNRVESEERVRPKEKVDLIGQIQTTLTTLRPLADGVSVVLNLDAPDEPVEVTGDTDQLRQVFTNLIENGIKYGASGGVVDVVVTLHDRDLAVRGPSVKVQVIDKGPGIDAVHLPRLTERFYRADGHRSRELGGTGLGLAIVKHIVNRHRGRLRVDSEPGAGASFTVILPR
ncbi:MAG: sensor histidine kinase [Ruegeria sp.]